MSTPPRRRADPIDLDGLQIPEAVERGRRVAGARAIVPTSARRHFEEHGPQHRGPHAGDVDDLVDELGRQNDGRDG